MSDHSTVELEPLFYDPGNPQFPTLPDGIPSPFIDDQANVAELSIEFAFPDLGIRSAVSNEPDALDLSGGYLGGTWVIDTFVDFGVIAAAVQRSITLTNTRRTPITVTAIAIPTAIGVTLISALPVTLQPLTSATFDFEASPAGTEAEFDAAITFTTSAGDLEARLAGQRLFMLEILAQRGIREGLRFRTGVIRSTGANESAYSIATSPLSVTTYFVREKDQNRRVLLRNAILSGDSRLLVGAPREHEAQPLKAPVSAADTILPVDTSTSSYEAGKPVSVVTEGGAAIRANIETVAADSLTLSSPIGTDLEAGVDVVPVGLGYISNFLDIATFPINLEDFTLSVTFNRDAWIGVAPPNKLFPALVEGDPVLEVLNEIPRTSKRSRSERSENSLDSGVTNRSARNAFPLGDDSIPFVTSIRSRADVWLWRQSLHWLAGSWLPFWLPTHQDDLQYAGALPASNTIDVVSTKLSAFGSPPKPPRSAIRLFYPDGTIEYRKINTVTDNGVTEQLVLSSAIPAGQPVISFLQRVRIVGDSAVFEHERAGDARLTFQVRTLQE